MRGRFAGICSFTMCFLQNQIKTYQHQVGEFKYKIDIQTCNVHVMSSGPPELENVITTCDMFFQTMEKRDWNEVGVPVSICLRSHQRRCSNVESLSRTVDHIDFEDFPCVFAIINCVGRAHFRDRCMVILYWLLCGQTGCSLHWILIWQISLQLLVSKCEQTWA